MHVRNILYVRLVTLNQQIIIGKSFSYKHGYEDTVKALISYLIVKLVLKLCNH